MKVIEIIAVIIGSLCTLWALAVVVMTLICRYRAKKLIRKFYQENIKKFETRLLEYNERMVITKEGKLYYFNRFHGGEVTGFLDISHIIREQYNLPPGYIFIDTLIRIEKE